MLSRDEARAFYDRFGARQDQQAFYEDAALEALVRHGELSRARRVFELGCGTGRLGHRLLSRELPPEAGYVGVDLSATMVGLASRRLAEFGDRARVSLSDGSPDPGLAGASFDRFVSTFVFDLLPEDQIARWLAEARRLLAPGGRLCLAGLTEGRTAVTRAVSRVWWAVHRLDARLVGGCRPIEIRTRLPGDAWDVAHHEVVSRWGIASEVLVAIATAVPGPLAGEREGEGP